MFRMRAAAALQAAIVLSVATHLLATPMVTITNDWASGAVRVVVPKGPPFIHDWSDAQQGEAAMVVTLHESGSLAPMEPTEYYSGRADARIGPSLLLDCPLSYTQVFGASVVADDNLHAEAQATMDTIWKMRVAEGPASFHARGFVENSHSLDFTLLDLTTQQVIVSRSIWGYTGLDATGTLEPLHDYLLTSHLAAMFGDGDGVAQFGFGVDATVVFSADGTHLPLPEPGGLSCFAMAACIYAWRRRHFAETARA